MIIFVLTAPQFRTHTRVVEALSDLPVKLLPYHALGQSDPPLRATYIFTDLERLPTEVLRLAGAAARRLRERGLRVLNDPARVLSRYGLLRKLALSGFNSFNVYRAEEGRAPERWPVFLRTEGDHIAPLPELYHTQQELKVGIAGAQDAGIPIARMLVVEYCAEPVRPGLFRKCSTFRIGSASFGHWCVHDNQWIAKEGRRGITPDDLYEQEFQMVRDNPYWDEVRPAFEAGGAEYGRADFGFVHGKLQLYEINSNPAVSFGDDHPHELRQRCYRLFREHYLAALRAIDTP